jgi:proteasome lid subunit RPN8/RPN11
MTPLLITAPTIAAIVSEVAAWGARDVETGGFLLGDHTGAISGVALSAAAGICRHRDQFVISRRAMATLFDYAGERGQAVRAQFHSHGGRAFLSRTDIRHGFNVDGFITTVVPAYAAPPPSPSGWGWWIHNSGWSPMTPPVVLRGKTCVVRFDENGAREN